MKNEFEAQIIRNRAMNWWDSLSFDTKFYKTIGWLNSKGKNSTERHPDNLTGREIEEIYKQQK